MMESGQPTVISLFTGGMGFDLGFEQRGFEVRATVDADPMAHATLKANNCRFPMLTRDVCTTSGTEILDAANLELGEPTVVTGAPPCEPFTTAGSRNGFEDRRANAVYAFIELVNELQPEYFAFEEVPGFLRAAKRHMSFYERVKLREDEIPPDSRLGSAFDEVMVAFQETGYKLSFDPLKPKSSLLNSADYGAPQKRIRFMLIGSRLGTAVALPPPTHGSPDLQDVRLGKTQPWVTLKQALRHLDSQNDERCEFPPKWGQYFDYVPPGGCWRDLPKHLHKAVLGGAYDDGTNPRTAGLKGGRTGFMRRLSWDKPAPTLVDRPTNKANSLCHPDEPRPLSVKEYARIQGFSDNWVFAGSLSQRYKLIGQATPVPLAAAIADQILKHRSRRFSQNGHQAGTKLDQAHENQRHRTERSFVH